MPEHLCSKRHDAVICCSSRLARAVGGHLGTTLMVLSAAEMADPPRPPSPSQQPRHWLEPKDETSPEQEDSQRQPDLPRMRDYSSVKLPRKHAQRSDPTAPRSGRGDDRHRPRTVGASCRNQTLRAQCPHIFFSRALVPPLQRSASFKTCSSTGAAPPSQPPGRVPPPSPPPLCPPRRRRLAHGRGGTG